MAIKKFGIYKLVRRFTKKQLEEKNVNPSIEELSRGRFLYQMRYKLIEESKEVLKSNNRQNLIEEMGDVFEVFNLILKENKISMSDVIASMQKKQSERGEICNLFMSTMEMTKDNELFEKYVKAGYKILE